jgi:hypothetical protein
MFTVQFWMDWNLSGDLIQLFWVTFFWGTEFLDRQKYFGLVEHFGLVGHFGHCDLKPHSTCTTHN